MNDFERIGGAFSRGPRLSLRADEVILVDVELVANVFVDLPVRQQDESPLERCFNRDESLGLFSERRGHVALGMVIGLIFGAAMAAWRRAAMAEFKFGYYWTLQGVGPGSSGV